MMLCPKNKYMNEYNLYECLPGLRTPSIFNRVRVQELFASSSSKNFIF